MSEPTENGRAWLDRRYGTTDAEGVYVPHQPVYGVQRGPHDQGVVPRTTRTVRILDVLAGLRFTSFLDVSAAEGYLAWLVSRAFGATAFASDLSPVAGVRAGQLFGLAAVAGDVHCLPFEDDAVDVVLCSQTLEHVDRPDIALRELLRVARRAVIVTVPHEDVHHDGHVAHDHVNEFDLGSFDDLANAGVRVVSFPVLSPRTRLLGGLVDGQRRPVNGRAGRRLALRLANAFGPTMARLRGRRMIAGLVERDREKVDTRHYETVFAILLQPGVAFDDSARGPGVDWILDQTVPPLKISVSMP